MFDRTEIAVVCVGEYEELLLHLTELTLHLLRGLTLRGLGQGSRARLVGTG